MDIIRKLQDSMTLSEVGRTRLTTGVDKFCRREKHREAIRREIPGSTFSLWMPNVHLESCIWQIQ
jgi:hypothetical protein